jgi:acyl carrier protein
MFMSTTISKQSGIPARVRTIIHEKLGVEQSALVDAASFTDDLGLDSLDVMETFMTLEKEFDLKIGDEEAERLTTVGAVIDYITRNVR